LPVLIFAAFIALTARVGDLWQGVGTIARAQTASPSGAATSTDAAEGEAGRNAPSAAAQTAAKRAEYAIDPMPPKPEAPPVQDLPADPFSLTDKEINLLQALAERRRELDLRARQLEQREALLKAAERRIEEKVGGLKALQKTIQDLLLQQEEQTESQYESLVKIYESMKPKDAARIFEEMDMSVLLPVVERMKERKTAPILAKMNPVKANAITTQLAQRRKSPTEEPEKQ
jgi:flagellar motility protein MotE (MotC chaperone)